MNFSKRENNLLNQLSPEYFVTANELAEELTVSKKTVYRLVKKINDVIVLEGSIEELILAEPGKGYSLNHRVVTSDFFINQKDQTKGSRKDEVLLKLLFRAPIKIGISYLFDEYYLSESSVERDLRQLNHDIKKYNLEIRKKNNYLWVVGNEVDIRKCINEIIVANSKFEGRFLIKDSMLEMNVYDQKFLNKQLDLVEKKLNQSLDYPYNVNLLTHLYMVIKRYREGGIQTHWVVEKLDDEERDSIIDYQQLYQIAREVIFNIEGNIGKKMPDIETFFLFQLILSTRYKENHLKSSEVIFAEKIASVYLNEVLDKNHNSNLKGPSKELFNDLLSHIAPMILRIQKEIYIENALYDEVIAEYGDIYQKVTKVSKYISQEFDLGTDISKEENAYLTLYFAKYFVKKDRKKRVLIMCSSGVGTSELLMMKVKENFPKLEIVDVISYRSYKKNQLKYHDVDLILSSIRLNKEEVNLPHLFVSALLSKKDILAINKMLKGL